MFYKLKQPHYALRTSPIIPLISKVKHGLFLCFCRSLGLNGIKVIVKSLGSGFHLPVPGLPRYDLVSKITVVKSKSLQATPRDCLLIHLILKWRPCYFSFIFMLIVHFSSISSAKFSRTRQVSRFSSWLPYICTQQRDNHVAVAILSKRSQRHFKMW